MNSLRRVCIKFKGYDLDKPTKTKMMAKYKVMQTSKVMRLEKIETVCSLDTRAKQPLIDAHRKLKRLFTAKSTTRRLAYSDR